MLIPMTFSKQKFREIVFQLLFSNDFSEIKEGETRGMLMEQLAVASSRLREAEACVEKILAALPEIDRMIAMLSDDYNFDRIPRVERAILRLGMFELLYDKEVPGKVCIAEAMRLSRKFATTEASTFINAILDKAFHTSFIEKT